MGKYLDENGLARLWQKVKTRIAQDVSGKQNKTVKVEKSGGTLSQTLADNTEYQFSEVSALTLSYPAGEFSCWISLSVGQETPATVSFPAGTTYIGNVPTSFEAGACYEISVKNKVVIVGKAGEG